MQKKWVAIMPCGIESIPMMENAKARGYSIVGIDQSPSAPAFKHCDLTINSKLDGFELIMHQLSHHQITPECFIPVVSDKAVFPAYILNLHFGLTKPNRHVLAFYSKSVLRNFLAERGFFNPKYYVISSVQELNMVKLGGKLIVKPDDSSGSRGISIINKATKQELIESFDFAIQYCSNQKVIVEEYIPGQEFMVDCFILNTKVKTILVSRKEKIQDKVSYLIETVNKNEFPYGILRDTLNKLVKELNYKDGPLHIEVKVINNQIYILDLGARGGGFGVFNFYTMKCTGFDFVSATLDVFLKKKLSNKRTKFMEGAIYFVTPEKEGILISLTSDYAPSKNDDVTINYYQQDNQRVTMDVTDGNRLAAIYCFAKTKKKLHRLLENVKSSFHQKIIQ